jgi:hypothetical protein
LTNADGKERPRGPPELQKNPQKTFQKHAKYEQRAAQGIVIAKVKVIK